MGAAAWLVDRLGFPWTGVIPVSLIGSWLAVAFVLGTTARTPATGALRGLIGLLAAVVAYYTWSRCSTAGSAVGARHAAFVWGTVALLAGPCLGLAGGVWRDGAGRPRALAVAVLAAGLIAEALVFGAGRLLHVDVVVDPGALVLGAELVLGLALPMLLLRGAERLTGTWHWRSSGRWLSCDRAGHRAAAEPGRAPLSSLRGPRSPIWGGLDSRRGPQVRLR